MEIERRIDAIKSDLEMFSDDLDRYDYLLSLGDELSPLDPQERIEAYQVKGCMSQVWLVPEKREGKLYFKADSDAQLVKGLAALLIQIYSGLSPATILNTETSMLERLEIAEMITPGRQNGIASMIEMIRYYAKGANNAP